MMRVDSKRICVSISGLDTSEILKTIKNVKMAEIRLDGLNLEKDDLKKIFSSPVELIATYRPGNFSEHVRVEFLTEAIENGASYVDVEIESSRSYREKIIRKAKEHGCKVILSYHNYEETPSDSKLREIIRLSLEYGGDIVKIACRANNPSDGARLIGLLGHHSNLVVIGMGEMGKITRIIAPLLGAPFTFASISNGMETADGQIDFERLERLMGSLV